MVQGSCSRQVYWISVIALNMILKDHAKASEDTQPGHPAQHFPYGKWKLPSYTYCSVELFRMYPLSFLHGIPLNI